jgi:hypothetical protein
MTSAIEMGRLQQLDWLLHFDTDELWIPPPTYATIGKDLLSLALPCSPLLSPPLSTPLSPTSLIHLSHPPLSPTSGEYLSDPERVPEDSTDISFPNYEALPEVDSVASEFDEVTLFKVCVSLVKVCVTLFKVCGGSGTFHSYPTHHTP